MEHVFIYGLCDQGSTPDWFGPILLVHPLQDLTMPISVSAFNLMGMGVAWMTFRSDRIVGIPLEPIPGHPMSSPIVFANPTFVPASPFVLSFV
jgi:hypothetical protein